MSNEDAQGQSLFFEVFFEPLVFLIGILLAGFVSFSISSAFAQIILAFFLYGGIALSGWRIIREAMQGRVGVDVIAISAMGVSAILGQWLAGIIILLMLSGGEALEAYASRRARRHLTNLLSGTPTIAHRKKGQRLSDIDVEQVAVGDVLVVKPGEIVPVDGVIASGATSIDEALLTGESLAVDKGVNDRVLGGSVNQNGLFEMRVTTMAAGSQYQRMVALVHEAEKRKAPLVRLADRYSFLFTVITFLMAALAWLVSYDPIRALAVLVVATPCPLILATPIAILSGMSRAAQRGIIMRGGGALEVLARVKAFIFDKTGTLTFGSPMIRRVSSFGVSGDEVLRLAASLDQGSSHVLARVLVTYAKQRSITLSFPDSFQEAIGKGVEGMIGGRRYFFGRVSYLKEQGADVPEALLRANRVNRTKGVRTVYLADDARVIGTIAFSDTLRPGLRPFFQSLRSSGAQRIEMLTGDSESVAKDLGKKIGVGHMRAECLPEDKVTEIQKLQKKYQVVAMIGDGVNDAPALATADVGIAMGANGSGAASESADIVITVDDVTRVSDAFEISRQTIRIAKTGIFLGMGLSMVLMVVAAAGYLPPVYGAIAQEVVDVVVIIQALRLSGRR